MDLFTKTLGPAYVPAFAGRLLLSMASGIKRSQTAVKRVLLDEEPEDLWTLGLIVVRWYAGMLPASEARLIAATLPDDEMISIVSNLSIFREQLLPFAKTAHEARSDAQLAAAGVYFVAAVEQIGLSMLSAAIKSSSVSVLQAKLQERLPLPDELKADYWRVLGVKPKGVQTLPTVPLRTSQSDRFDRADLGERSRPAAQPPAPAVSSLSTPRLAQAEVTRAYLHTLGWRAADIDRLLAGPNRPKDV